MRLYITEKPKQVEALKKVIKEKALFAPLAGHIMETYKPHDFDKDLDIKNWYKSVMDNKYPFFPTVLKKKVKGKSVFKVDGKAITMDYKKKFEDVKAMIEQCSEIVIASDPDNEGVVLAMEVIEACKAEKKVIGMINMAKLDPISLAKEINIINKIPYVKMNDAGNTRGEFDWLFGMNLSPIASIYLGKGQTIHMGGVKLPTIRMVVERDLAFESFSEIPFWELKGTAKDPKTGIEFPINIKYDGQDRFDSEEAAKKAIEELNKKVKVSDYRETNKTTQPPKPYSLTDLQSEGGRMFKLSAQMVSDSAQRLYINGDQSYPRTEENYYAEGQYAEIEDTIKHLKTIDLFKNANIKKPYLKREIFNDKKLEGKAHTALCPTMQKADLSKMNDIDKKIYMLVATRYFIQFMEDYKYLNISIKSIDGKFEISASENIETFKGWRELFSAETEEMIMAKRTFPELNKGDDLYIVKVDMKKGTTKPKPRFTESTLLKAMEKISTIYDDPQVKEHLGENGIGTPATRATILEELKANKRKTKNGVIDIEPYIIIDKGKVVSTQKARDMIALLPDNITSPVLRAELEAMTKSIVYENKNPKDIMDKIKNTIKTFVQDIINVSKDNNIKVSSGGFSDKISDKQLNFAKSIAKSKGIDLPEDCENDKDKLKEFIEKNKEDMEYKFSDKQIAILEKIEDKKIKDLLNKSNLTKEDFEIGNKAIKDYFDNSKKSKTFQISEKQKAIILNEKNNAPKTLLKLVESKTEFDSEEYNKIQTFLNKIFKSFKK